MLRWTKFSSLMSSDSSLTDLLKNLPKIGSPKDKPRLPVPKKTKAAPLVSKSKSNSTKFKVDPKTQTIQLRSEYDKTVAERKPEAPKPPVNVSKEPVFKPYPGSQIDFLQSSEFEVLLAGTRGGGK